jgi:hypothetical protein
VSTPCVVLRTRKPTSSRPGPELNENERAWSVPGTWMLTYWPGRNASAAGSVSATVNAIAVSDTRSTAAIVPSCVATPVLATSEVAGMRRTRSERGTAWQVST